MDPLSHVVAGRAVTALFDNGRYGPGLGAAAILGALAPDVDLLLAPAGWDVYLRAHQAGTHSIAGGLLVAWVSASIVRGVVRGSRYRPLAAAAAAGAMSHLALDVMSGARTRLTWPFVDTPVTLPLVAMADPWLVAIFVAGLLALWPRSVSEKPQHAPSRPASPAQELTTPNMFARVARLLGVRLALLGRTPRRRRLRTVAPVMLGTAIGFLCLKGALLDRALRASHLEPDSPRAIEARWGSLTEWDVFGRTPAALHAWRISSRGGPATERLSRPLQPESALVAASRSLDTVRNFLRAHEYGFPVEAPAGDGRTAVRWSDLRYCWRTADSAGAVACALWFGGVFGPDGRALTQEVTVGPWKQTRAAPQ
jgi:membrane-bound metal-dependent hydrolase YbcI (DUF457 family)